MKLICLSLILFLSFPSAYAQKVNSNPLKATAEAFPSSIPQGANGEIKVYLDLAENHHAYVDQFKLEVKDEKKLKVGKINISPTVKFYDVFSKKEKIGVKNLSTIITIFELPTEAPLGESVIDLQLTYQACTKKYCLLPKTISVPLKINALSASSDYQGIQGEVGGFELSKAQEKSLLFLIALVFLAGLLTSFTPCVFPMIPITLAVIGAQSKGQTRLRSFLISLTYVNGIAVTYSILGILAAKTGSLFGSFLGNPIFAIGLGLLFTVLALSMFGLFEIQLPNFINNRLNAIKTKSGFLGAFVTGLLAGIIASPCVGPVLIGVLTYVSQTQDTTLGFVLLYSFAIGFGVLFMVLGAFSHLINKIPKSGPWMNRIKAVFGVAMLGLALYYVYPVLPKSIKNFGQETSQVPWQTYSDAAVEAARVQGKPIIIDFYADWCAACKELEKYTFNSPEVLDYGKSFVWLQFDATKDSPERQRLEKKYNIFGLPHIAFYDKNGKLRTDLTLTGMEEKELFLKRMKKAYE